MPTPALIDELKRACEAASRLACRENGSLASDVYGDPPPDHADPMAWFDTRELEDEETASLLRKRWGDVADLIAALESAEAENAALREEREAIEFAAHMPADYKHGLPSWINQRLYAAYIGAYFSPEVMQQIESGTLRFENSPDAKENAELRKQLANLKAAKGKP